MDAGTFATPLELKYAGDRSAPGTFEGYGACFGNIDRGGDVIEPGAFTKSLDDIRAMGVGSAPMYYNHNRDGGTIGVWEKMVEDSNGLHVRGRLIGLDTEFGKMNYARLREGAIKGLSIGYRVSPGGSQVADVKGRRCRKLKQVDLSEVSLVDDPMNPQAKINFMKSTSLIMGFDFNPRELERGLREEGLSRTDAKKAVGFLQSYRRDAGAVEKFLRDEVDPADVLKKHIEGRLQKRLSLFTKG